MAHELKYKLCYNITRLSSDEIFSSIEACEAGARTFYCLVTLTSKGQQNYHIFMCIPFWGHPHFIQNTQKHAPTNGLDEEKCFEKNLDKKACLEMF